MRRSLFSALLLTSALVRDPEPAAARAADAAETTFIKVGEVSCELHEVGTVTIDAWGGEHHVEATLVLAGCKGERRKLSEQAKSAARAKFESLVVEHSFMTMGICLQPPQISEEVSASYQVWREQVVDAANDTAGSKLVKGLACSRFRSSESM